MKRTKTIPLLTLVVALAAAGYFVYPAAPAAAVELRISIDEYTDCGLIPSDGVIVEGAVDGVFAYRDTVFAQPDELFVDFDPPRINGIHRIRARGFALGANNEYILSREFHRTTCEIDPSSEGWSIWSGPFEQPAGPGTPGQPVVRAVVR